MKNNKSKNKININIKKKKLKNEKKIKQYRSGNNRREQSNELERDLNIESFMYEVLIRVYPDSKNK